MIDFTDRINELTDYAKNKLGLDKRDEFYVKNRLAEIFLSGAEGAELGSICYRILENTAVFADDWRFGEFLIKAGFEL